MTAEQVEVLIVGAGPAGLAAATQLKRQGVANVLVVDREPRPGGVPNFCHHTGFGIFELKRLYDGPGYARYHAAQAQRAGVNVWTETTITGWQGPTRLSYTSPRGLGDIEARAVLLATGCRERPRSARLVPGYRPAGVFTTGSLQRFIYEQHLPVGRRAVIVGAELVSLSAVMSLGHARVPVARMVTELAQHGIPTLYLPPKWWLMDGLWRVPLDTRARITRVLGHRRVEGVEITDLPTGQIEIVDCDTVVFTGDWMPEHELARHGGLTLHAGSHGPQVDGGFHTSRPGVFAAGNLLRGSETADRCALEGARAAAPLARYLRDGQWPPAPLPIVAAAPLEWIFPNAVSPATPPPFGVFSFRVQQILTNAAITVYQGTRRLHQQRYRALKPYWSAKLGSDWLRAVDLSGEPLRAVVEA